MKREVPIKNYIILAVIVLLTVALVFYMRSWYNTSKEWYAQHSVITDVVREIKSDELSSVTLENQKFILYTSSSTNMLLKDFEDDFKDLIKDMDLSNDIIYINLDGTDVNSFYDLLRNDFAGNSKVKNQIVNNSEASLYLFTNGKITNLLNNVNNYSMNRIETIIDRWEIK